MTDGNTIRLTTAQAIIKFLAAQYIEIDGEQWRLCGGGFGIFGLILKRLNLPIVPIILGMVLGGIMEVKLRTSLIRVKTPLDFVDRPIAAILACMLLLVIVLHIRTLVREHRARLAEGEIDHDMHDSQQR